MKHTSLLGAAAIILLANTFALVHAAMNRSGTPESEIVLTDRELKYYGNLGDEDSGVELRIDWSIRQSLNAVDFRGLDPPEEIFDTQKLQQIGFDCSVAPGDSKAGDFYARQRPRRAFVALEYNGPAWRAFLERFARAAEQRADLKDGLEFQRNQRTQLWAIDGAGDPETLRARYPDRNSILILPAVITISHVPNMPEFQGRPARAAHLTGNIQQVPSTIHVPRPFSDGFRRRGNTSARPKEALETPLYRVHLRYGSALEPWITAVEFGGQ